MAGTQRTRSRSCAICSSSFEGRGVAKYCSKRCVNRAREDRRAIACSQCGGRMWSSWSVAEKPTCQPCRRTIPGHFTADRIAASEEQAWACGACGDISVRPATRGQKPKWCVKCRNALRDRGIKISVSERIAIYERDNWTCWLCEESVDRKLIRSRSQWRPSLDHITPRSKGGSDDPMNLRLAHFWCNSVLSDGRTYTPEDFRVSA